MLASFGYRKHNSLIEKFDPRARWIFSLIYLFAIVLFWDIRFLSFFFALAMIQFYLSRLTWAETRRAWLVIIFLATTMILVNTIITSAGTIGGVITGGSALIHFVIHFPVTGWVINYTLTSERAWFALAQYLRVLAIAAIFLIIPYTMNPKLYGVTFRGIVFSDKLAFTMDLAFRFIPTLSRDFQITMDSQRARGFEIEKAEGGVIARIRRVAPLLVPVTMNAIMAGEDIANAMDLRCFGLRRRTWAEPLKYHWMDFALIGFGLLLLLGGMVIRFSFGIGDFWMPGM
jgi:energy-coupling factor transport system permease protein